MAKVVLERPPANEEELYWLVQALWGVTIPRHSVCPDHIAPFDAFADAYFGRDGSISLWHGSRGLSGKSFMLSILGITKAFIQGADVNLLGGSLAQSVNIHEHMRNAFNHTNAPTYMIETEANTQIKLSNNARIRPLTASQKTVRGPHPPFLICVAEGTLVQTPNGPVEIQDVKVGHTVLGSHDMTTECISVVSKVTRSGYQATVVVETEHDRITCTPDHRIWTQRGWVEAQHLTSQDMLTVRNKTVRQWREEDWDVSGMLDSRAEQTAGEVSVSGMRGRSSHAQGDTMQEVLRHQQSSSISTLQRVRGATQTEDDQALSPLSFEVHEQRQGSNTLFSSPCHGEGRGQEVQSRGSSSRTSRSFWDSVSAFRPLREMGTGLYGGEGSHRSPRDVLARSAQEQGAGREEEEEVRGGRVHSTVLENRPDTHVVVKSVQPGPYVMTWDITTSTGNFFANDILVHNCDEIDEMEEDILNAALGQPMPQKNYLGEVLKPYTVMCSTWQNADGTFEHKYREFQDKGLPIKTWCFLESANDIDGWLSKETIEQKRREIPAEMWRVEYELGEPSIGNRAFDTEAIEKTFNLPVEPISEVKKERYEEYVFEKPVSDGVYVVAADWAKEQDYTVISVVRVDRQPHTLVHYRRVNRRPYPMMISWFNEVIDMYNAEAIHDATGLGNVVNDYIDVRARKFIMTGEKRSNMLTEYVGAVERGYFELPRIPSLYTAHKYCVRKGSLVRTLGGSKPIEQIKIGDMVLTRNGYKRVYNTACNGTRNLHRLLTSDGKELFLTEDHSVATLRGWIRADALEIGDVCFVSGTDTTATSAVTSDNKVLAAVGMPVGAVSSSSALGSHSIAAHDIDTLADIFKVLGVDTTRITAQMVQDALDVWIPEYDVTRTMSQPEFSADPYASVSLRMLECIPLPASARDNITAFVDQLRAQDIGFGHVIQCSPYEQDTVYDISVEDTPEFFANDILVHNCRTGDLYSGSTKDYHLPDEVCSMALAWHAAKRFSGYGEAITIKRVPGPGRYEKNFEMPKTDEGNSIYSAPMYEVDVKTKGEDDGISLLV